MEGNQSGLNPQNYRITVILLLKWSMENLACILLLPVSYKLQILEITPEKLSPFNIALTAIMKSSILYKSTAKGHISISLL